MVKQVFCFELSRCVAHSKCVVALCGFAAGQVWLSILAPLANTEGTPGLMEVRLESPMGCLPGPATLQESSGWYDDALRLLSPAAKQNLQRNVNRLFYSSHCSGMGCLEQIMENVGGTSTHASDILETRPL